MITLQLCLIPRSEATAINEQTEGILGFNPVIMYFETPIYNGMEDISENALLFAHYEFDIEAGYSFNGTVELPYPLIAAEDGLFPVTARDSYGNEFNAGDLAVGAGGRITLNIYNIPERDEEDLSDGTDDFDDPEDVTGDGNGNYPDPSDYLSAEGNGYPDDTPVVDTYSNASSDDNPDAQTLYSGFSPNSIYYGYDAHDSLHEPQVYLVYFEIPCMFDMDELFYLSMLGQPYQVTLLSDGIFVTLTLLPEDSPDEPVVLDLGTVALSDAIVPTTPFTSRVTVDDYLLYRRGTDTQLKNGDTFDDLNVDLELRYYFEISNLLAQEIYNNHLGARFLIPIPEGLKWDENKNFDLLIDYGGGITEKYATVDVKIGGVGALIFEGDFWTNNAPRDLEVLNGWLILHCALDEKAIGNMYEFEIKMPNDKTLTFYNNAKKPAELFLSKTGFFSENRFNWQVVYNKGDATPEYPLTFVDTFDHANHILVRESLDNLPPGVTAKVDEYKEGDTYTTVRFTITSATALSWAYQTRLSDNAVRTPGETPAANKVELFEDEKTVPSATAAAGATASGDNKRWMGKVGRQIGDTGRIMEWEITINTLDRYLTDLVLYDKLPFGLTLLPNTVMVNNVPIGETENIAFTWLDNNSGSDNKQAPPKNYDFRVVFPKSGNYPSTYTIKYQTTIAPGYFNNPSDTPVSSFQNDAWLSFDWHRWSGTGPGTGEPWPPFTPPSLLKPGEVVTNVLAKNAVRYDRANHEITWRIDVNPFGVNIQGGTITDDLTSLGQTFAGTVSDPQIQIIGDRGTTTSITLSADRKILTIPVGEVGTGGRVSFEFKTKVDNPDHFAANHDGVEYTNTATYKGNVGAAYIEDSVTAKITVVSQMLAKRAASQQYRNGKLIIGWQLTVNQNSISMTGANPKIIDTLPLGLTYVTGSLMVGGIETAPIQVSGSPMIIEIPATSTTYPLTITYETEVHPDAIPAFKISGPVAIQNSAELANTGYAVAVNATGTSVVSNQKLDKTGDYNSVNRTIEYTVNINPNGVNLADQVLIDDLAGGNLRLDIASVELIEATINSNGTFTEKAEGKKWLYNDPAASNRFDFTQLSASPPNFSIKLPDGNDRYILKYECYYTPGTNLKNSIEFADVGGGIKGDDNATANTGGTGGGTGVRRASLIMTVQDELRPGVKLGGIVYELYHKIGGDFDPIFVTKVTSLGNTGIAAFHSIRVGEEYYIKQVNAIDGYPMDTMAVLAGSASDNTTVTSAVLDGELHFKIEPHTPVVEQRITVTYKPNANAAGFLITVKSDEVPAYNQAPGTFAPLLGAGKAIFKITDLTPGSTYTKDVSTDADGIVKFGEMVVGLPFGRYKIEQINTPLYHTPRAEFTVTIAHGGTTATTAAQVNDVPNDGGVASSVHNVFYRPDLTINKSRVGTSGINTDRVTFKLFDITITKTEVDSKTIAVNESVTFPNLLGGHSYVVEEVHVDNNGNIDKYYQTNTHTVPTIDEASLGNVTWRNYTHSAAITVTVQDSMRTDKKLPGATFELYEKDPTADTNQTPIRTAITQTNGTLQFTGLKMTQSLPATSISNAPSVENTDYWLVQIDDVPGGYKMGATATSISPYKVSLLGTNGYAGNTNVTVNNTPHTPSASLTFTVYSDKENPYATLSGVQFQMKDNYSTLVIISTVSGADGMIAFSNIPFGTYTVTQIASTVPDYHKAAASFTVVIGEDGELVSDTLENSGEIIVPVFRKPLTVTARNADTSANIPSVQFELWLNGAAAASEDKGTGVAFTPLLGGNNYTVKASQSSIPPGFYLPPAEHQIGIINDEIALNLEWRLYPYAAKLAVTKIDAERKDVKLADAVFELYASKEDAENPSTLPIDTKTTNAEGVALFEDLALTLTNSNFNAEPILAPKDYWLVEKTAPAGYKPNTNPIRVTLTPTGPVPRTATYTHTVENEPVKGTVMFTKRGDPVKDFDGTTVKPLGGAVFKLKDQTPDSNWEMIVTSSSVVGSIGEVKFENVPHGTYHLTEESAPFPYVMMSGHVVVVIDPDGVSIEFDGKTDPSLFTLTNTISDASIEVTAIVEDGSNEDIKYILERKTGTGGNDWSSIGYGYEFTDVGGKVKFEGLYPEMDYRLRVESPTGHYISGPYMFKAGVDEEKKVTWYHHKIQTGSITITKKENLPADIPPGRDILISGAEFTLHRNGTIQVGAPQTTNSSGTTEFNNLTLNPTMSGLDGNDLYKELTLNAEYTVRETTAAPGYERDTTDHNFTLSNNAPIIDNLNKSKLLRAAPRTDTVTFTNINDWDIPLVGSSFTLTDKTTGSSWTATAISGSGGTVTFSNVPFGTYTLAQNVTPDNHDALAGVYADITVNVAATTSIVTGIPNGKVVNDSHKGSVTINLQASQTSLTLPHPVKFIIRDANGIVRGEEYTAPNGELTFDGLMVGIGTMTSYTIYMSTPTGFYPSAHHTINAPATKNETLPIGWFSFAGQGTVKATVTSKQDGIPLSGVVFGIFDASGNLLATTSSLPNGTLIFENLPLVTTAAGMATFNTPPTLAGTETKYTIKQIENYSGYVPLSAPIPVEIAFGELDVEIALIKNPITSGESSGSGGNNPGGSGGLGGSGSGGHWPPSSWAPNSPSPSPGGGSGDNDDTGADVDSSDEPDDDSDNSGGGTDSTGTDATGNSESGGHNKAPGEPAVPEYYKEDGERVIVPELRDVHEDDILRPSQLPKGFSVVQIDDDTYVIYDDNGTPLGYVILPEGMTLDEIDIMSMMRSFIKVNPKTGDASDNTTFRFELLLLLLLLTFGVAMVIKRGKNA